MSDIFISYAREDREKAKALAVIFEAQGWSVWWDRNIPAGKSFDSIIEAEIEAAKCIVVLWSANSATSDWVKGEAGEAVTRQVMVPVRIDTTKIPLEFRRLQTVDLCGWDPGESHPEMAALLEAISAQIKAPVKLVPGGPRWRPSRGQLIGFALGALLVVGAIAFLVMRRPAAESSTTALAPVAESTANSGETEITTTRNLRLEFLQDDQPCRMFVATDASGYSVVRVLLQQRPVEVRCAFYENAIQLCAWSDDSIFGQIDAGMKLKDVPYFTEGTGMATPEGPYPTLVLDNRAQHYIVDDRFKRIGSDRVSFTFNSAQSESGTLAKWPPRIYLVVLSDVNHRTVVDADEFERVILEFDQ